MNHLQHLNREIAVYPKAVQIRSVILNTHIYPKFLLE